MVEVSILFVVINGHINETVDCASFYLIDKGSNYTMLTERVLKCQKLESKITEMINSTPFNITRVLYTFGMSAIAIVDTNKPFDWLSKSNNREWEIFNLEEASRHINANDYDHIEKFLEIMKSGKFFEINDN